MNIEQSKILTRHIEQLNTTICSQETIVECSKHSLKNAESKLKIMKNYLEKLKQNG